MTESTTPKQKSVSKVKFFTQHNKVNITIENIESKEIRDTVLKSYHHQFVLVGTVKVLLRHIGPVFSQSQRTFQILDTLNGSKYNVTINDQCTDDLTELF